MHESFVSADKEPDLWHVFSPRDLYYRGRNKKIILIKRQFIGGSNMDTVTTRAPHNVRCSYSAKQIVSEVRT